MKNMKIPFNTALPHLEKVTRTRLRSPSPARTCDR